MENAMTLPEIRRYFQAKYPGLSAMILMLAVEELNIESPERLMSSEDFERLNYFLTDELTRIRLESRTLRG